MAGNPIIPISTVMARSDNPDGSFGLWFDCPGCKLHHCITIGPGAGPRWDWDGIFERPTFTPSVLVRYNWGPEQKAVVCHSFITRGQIQFLGDCTHELAGQTVDLPPYGTVDD